MGRRAKPNGSSGGANGAGESREIAVLLATADEALRKAWAKTAPPPGFRLTTTADLRPEHLTGRDVHLVLVDVSAAGSRGALGDALRRHAARIVWVGPAEALAHLGPERLAEAYDSISTPAEPALLGQRLAWWARSIQRTAAMEDLGRRAEDLAGRNERLAARLSEVETGAQALLSRQQVAERILQRVRQVARLSRKINTLDLAEIVRVAIEMLPALVEAQRASFYLYDDAADRLVLQGHTHGRPIAERVDLKENPRSPMAVAVRRGELLLISEFSEFERAEDLALVREFQDEYATRSCIIVPLKGGGRVRGILNLADKGGDGHFDESVDLPVVEQIAELIGASIYNIELYREQELAAKTDPLTGLANRRAIEEILARETDRSHRYGSHLTVLMIDVDHLKTINDKYGHDAGDECLRSLAATIAETVRSVDVPGRWTGGDEFLVVLPDTPAAAARRLAQRILDRVQSRTLVRGREHLAASLSIGMAEYDRNETAESIIHRVDRAMYAAKKSGRNRIATDGETA
jgi:diguanylate cyclase (GGDEF)-like protein